MLTSAYSALYFYDHDTKIVTMTPSGADVPVGRPERAAAPVRTSPRGISRRANFGSCLRFFHLEEHYSPWSCARRDTEYMWNALLKFPHASSLPCASHRTQATTSPLMTWEEALDAATADPPES